MHDMRGRRDFREAHLAVLGDGDPFAGLRAGSERLAVKLKRDLQRLLPRPRIRHRRKQLALAFPIVRAAFFLVPFKLRDIRQRSQQRSVAIHRETVRVHIPGELRQYIQHVLAEREVRGHELDAVDLMECIRVHLKFLRDAPADFRDRERFHAHARGHLARDLQRPCG